MPAARLFAGVKVAVFEVLSYVPDPATLPEGLETDHVIVEGWTASLNVAVGAVDVGAPAVPAAGESSATVGATVSPAVWLNTTSTQ